MQHHRLLLAVAALAATTIAQTNVLPTSAATIGGGQQNAFPWGTTAAGWPGLRILCIYDSTHFTAAPVPIANPILMTSISWRANDVPATTSWVGGTYSNATVRVATAAVDHLGATTNWASNFGPDVTVVHNGPVTVAGGSGNGVGVPGPNVVTITLNPPFLYDPSAGDLVVDTEWTAPSFVGGSQATMDVHDVNVLGRRVYGSSSYPAANGVDSSCPVIEVGYAPAGGTIATNTTLGQGCIRSVTSFYEFFPTPATFDLSGTSILMIPTGGGSYVVTQGLGFLSVGSVQAVPTALALGDNAGLIQPLTVGSFAGPLGPWTSLSIISNGIISQAAGNTLVGAPNPATLLAGPQTGFYSQGDFDPIGGTGSGTIWFEESAAVITVTWDNVKSRNVAGFNTFQFQLYPSGLVNIAWVGMSPLAGNGGLMVGYSPAGPSLDPGNFDLTTLGAGALTVGTVDIRPLGLNSITRPITGTNWNVNLVDIPATGGFGVEIYGLGDPNVPDLFFLGMPTCGLRSTLDVLNTFLVAGSTHPYGLAIPNAPGLLGTQLFTTGAVWQFPPANAFGAITSNGIKGTIGDS